MRPINFPESNAVLQKPRGVTSDVCAPLCVHRMGRDFCISCWRPSWLDIIRIVFRQKLWLWVWGGMTQPPVAIETKSPWRD